MRQLCVRYPLTLVVTLYNFCFKKSSAVVPYCSVVLNWYTVLCFCSKLLSLCITCACRPFMFILLSHAYLCNLYTSSFWFTPLILQVSGQDFSTWRFKRCSGWTTHLCHGIAPCLVDISFYFIGHWIFKSAVLTFAMPIWRLKNPMILKRYLLIPPSEVTIRRMSQVEVQHKLSKLMQLNKAQ